MASVGAPRQQSIGAVFEQMGSLSVFREVMPGTDGALGQNQGQVSCGAPGQSGTIGWSQLLSMIGDGSSTIPPVPLDTSPSLPEGGRAPKLDSGAPLPMPGHFPPHNHHLNLLCLPPPTHSPPLNPGTAVAPVPEATLPRQSNLAGRREVDPSDAAIRNETQQHKQEEAEPPVRKSERRAKVRAKARVREELDEDWEMDEEDHEKEWKEPNTRASKEPKVNVRV
jgi:hypothetical protein